MDTNEERVDAVVLDNGAGYPARAFRIRDGQPVLLTIEPRGVPGRAATREAPLATETISLREEELGVRKRAVPAGEVEIRKEVVTEYRTTEVPVQREEISVERRPVEGPPVEGRELSDLPIADMSEGETICIPVREEEVIGEKRPVVREEIEVSERAVIETEHVAGTVEQEEVRIEREGDVDVRGSGRETRAAGREHRWVDNRCTDCGETRVWLSVPNKEGTAFGTLFLVRSCVGQNEQGGSRWRHE